MGEWVTVIPVQAHVITGLIAGEDIDQGDACGINHDAKVYRAQGMRARRGVAVAGFAAEATKADEPVTLASELRSYFRQ